MELVQCDDDAHEESITYHCNACKGRAKEVFANDRVAKACEIKALKAALNVWSANWRFIYESASARSFAMSERNACQIQWIQDRWQSDVHMMMNFNVVRIRACNIFWQFSFKQPSAMHFFAALLAAVNCD
jgi:hypothetical protein